MWFQCEDCPFATNSPKGARVHGEASGHDMSEEIEDGVAYPED